MKEMDDAKIDSDLMDELMEAMSGKEKDKLFPDVPEHAAPMIEIHVHAGEKELEVEKKGEEDDDVPTQEELDELMKKAG